MEYYLPKVPLLSETILPITQEELETFKPVPPKKNNNVAIIMSHFLRDKILLTTLNSIFEYQPGYKVYIADQGVYNENLEKLYKILKENGHEVVYAGYDAGISRCRNLLVNKSTEPYIYWQDDDDCFLADTDLSKTIKILEKNPEIGVVGLQAYVNGKIEHYEHFISIENRKINYIPAWNNSEKSITYCDMVLNNSMARRDIFKEITWDERLKLAEHLDFFLQLKYKTNWKVAYTNVFIKNQGIKIDDQNYKLFRGRNVYFWQYYIQKWDVDYIHNLEFKSNAPWKIKLFNKNTDENKSVENSETISIDISPKSVENIQPRDITEILKRLLNINCNFWLTNNSCLEAVLYNKLKNNKIEIGVKTEKEKNEILNSVKSKIPLEITVDGYTKTKSWKIYGLNLSVPCPVVAYLEKYSKKPWEILKNE